MNYRTVISFLVVCFSLISTNVFAGITLSGTRLIFNGSKNESSITVNNPDNTPYLVQSWVSVDDKKSSTFIVTPPLFRMDGNTSNALRIVLAKNQLPQDRESLFWLNVKGIPPSNPDAKDTLLIALNTKIKLIYRPKDLFNQDASTAFQKLVFKLDRTTNTLIASNPTAYYINLSTLIVNNHKVDYPGFVAPFSEQKWKIKPSGADKVEWNAINDFGGITDMMTNQLN